MSGVIIKDEGTAKRLNQLSREQMKNKLLNDILLDLTICEIEGWSKQEYLLDLKNLILSINKQ